MGRAVFGRFLSLLMVFCGIQVAESFLVTRTGGARTRHQTGDKILKSPIAPILVSSGEMQYDSDGKCKPTLLWQRGFRIQSENVNIHSPVVATLRTFIILWTSRSLQFMQMKRRLSHLPKLLSVGGSVFAVGVCLPTIFMDQIQSGVAWYLAQLAVNPLITKSITASTIGLVGDVVAQAYEGSRQNEKATADGSGNDLSRQSHGSYDSRRGLAIAAESLLFSGPLMHFGYSFFECTIPVASSPFAAILHVAADTILLDSIFVATTYFVSGLFEGMTLPDLVRQLRRDYKSTLRLSWAASLVMLPFECVCFRFLPVSLRTLAVNILDIFWDAFVSFAVHRKRGTFMHEADAQQFCVASLD